MVSRNQKKQQLRLRRGLQAGAVMAAQRSRGGLHIPSQQQLVANTRASVQQACCSQGRGQVTQTSQMVHPRHGSILVSKHACMACCHTPLPSASITGKATLHAKCGSGRSACLMCIALVQTGRSVSQQYAAARDEARDHARIRNAYFQQVGSLLCNGSSPSYAYRVFSGNSTFDPAI